jgi:hypothetical protein
MWGFRMVLRHAEDQLPPPRDAISGYLIFLIQPKVSAILPVWIPVSVS